MRRGLRWEEFVKIEDLCKLCPRLARSRLHTLRIKDKKEQSDYYQQQVQKPSSVMVWGGCVSVLCKGHLHFCDGGINA